MISPGLLTGEVVGPVVTPQRKAAILQMLAELERCSPEQVSAFSGDHCRHHYWSRSFNQLSFFSFVWVQQFSTFLCSSVVKTECMIGCSGCLPFYVFFRRFQGDRRWRWRKWHRYADEGRDGSGFLCKTQSSRKRWISDQSTRFRKSSVSDWNFERGTHFSRSIIESFFFYTYLYQAAQQLAKRSYYAHQQPMHQSFSESDLDEDNDDDGQSCGGETNVFSSPETTTCQYASSGSIQYDPLDSEDMYPLPEPQDRLWESLEQQLKRIWKYHILVKVEFEVLIFDHVNSIFL